MTSISPTVRGEPTRISRPQRTGRWSFVAFIGLLVGAFLVWPGPTLASVVLLAPAAALLFPILESGRLRERSVWRLLVAYGLVAYAGASVVVLGLFPILFPVLLLFPFFAALLVLVREAIPVPEP